MMAIGRFGGIAGSFLVAALAARELSFSQIFTVLALPGLIAMAALIVKQIAAPKAAPQVAAIYRFLKFFCRFFERTLP